MGETVSVGAAFVPGEGCGFLVWAPYRDRVEVELLAPRSERLLLQPTERGYHCGIVDGVAPGARYRYRLDGDVVRPDPASRHQPDGVDGPSQVIDPRFDWTDAGWEGRPLEEYVLYELHVGTFTEQGSFDAAIDQLDGLADLGITAVEVMPVAQFPGHRNWGYDGVFPYAVQNSYGGPDGLRRLVDACHARGLAVVLDVVYNHIGPEGNVLGDYGPYFTDRYRTPWGEAINFDGAGSDEVRRYFLENAVSWTEMFHVDALRLDALHAVYDRSATPFLQELSAAVAAVAERSSRHIHLIAESDLNDSRLIRSPAVGGYGLDAQWNDDFHHALHTLLTGERAGYYRDFGDIGDLTVAHQDGYVYAGQYSPYRDRRHGNRADDLPSRRFVVYGQNHDQVGNRAGSERLSRLVSFEQLKLAAAIVVLSPFVPLLFMGEEYGETAPFPFFIDHDDPDLVEAVRRGRREEFAAFDGGGEPLDPYAEETYRRAILDRSAARSECGRRLWAFYRELIMWRHRLPDADSAEARDAHTGEEGRWLTVLRGAGEARSAAIYHFDAEERTVVVPLPAGRWRKRIDSADPRWGGGGSRLPDELSSSGEETLIVAPYGAVVFTDEAQS